MMKRKGLIKKTTSLLLIVFTSCIVLNCSKSNDPDPVQESDPVCPNGITTTISDDNSNGHNLEITVEDIIAGVEKTYFLQSSTQAHAHDVILTAEDFLSLKNGSQVSLGTTGTAGWIVNHTHYISVKCE